MSTLAETNLLQGRYRVQRRLQSGGMGSLFLAWDAHLARPCAVKALHGDLAPTGDVRWHGEARVLAALNHPGVPRVLDWFDEDGQWYVVMEYVDGSDLEALLGEQGSGVLDEVSVAWMGCGVLDILDYLHTQAPAVVHRDIKPSNVMLRATDGTIVLVDFGIATTPHPPNSGTLAIGTPLYAPPEQFAGRPEPRSDLYALAATMMHLLTGRAPQTPFSFVPVRSVRPEVSLAMEEVLARSLALDPAARFSNAAVMHTALKNVLRRLLSEEASAPRLPLRSVLSRVTVSPQRGFRYRCPRCQAMLCIGDGRMRMVCHACRVRMLVDDLSSGSGVQ